MPPYGIGQMFQGATEGLLQGALNNQKLGLMREKIGLERYGMNQRQNLNRERMDMLKQHYDALNDQQKMKARSELATSTANVFKATKDPNLAMTHYNNLAETLGVPLLKEFKPISDRKLHLTTVDGIPYIADLEAGSVTPATDASTGRPVESSPERQFKNFKANTLLDWGRGHEPTDEAKKAIGANDKPEKPKGPPSAITLQKALAAEEAKRAQINSGTGNYFEMNEADKASALKQSDEYTKFLRDTYQEHYGKGEQPTGAKASTTAARTPDMTGKQPGWYKDPATGKRFKWDGKTVTF